MPSVALIGTPDDFENQRTYFSRPFRWPAHVMNFAGALDLATRRACYRNASRSSRTTRG